MFSKVLKATLCGATAIAAATALTSCVSINVKEAKLDNFNRSFTDKSFTEIDADIDWGELKIVPSSDNKVTVDAKDVPDTFKSEIKDGVLIVDFNTKSGTVAPRKAKTSVTIKVPSKDYEKLDLDLGAGDTTLEDLSISTIDIDCGAGELNINNIEADETLDISGGAGSIDISDSITGGLDADLGVGEFNFDGTVNGDIDIECGIGNVDIDLTNPESDFKGSNSKYSLKVDKGLGKFSISYNN